MSTLRMWQGVAGACHLVPVFEVQLSDVGDGGHRVSGYADAPLRLVSGDVVCDQPDERRQRPGLATGPRAWQLSNRLVVAAQVAARDGSIPSRSAGWLG